MNNMNVKYYQKKAILSIAIFLPYFKRKLLCF